MVSVILLAHNHAPYTRQCLLSVLQTQPPDIEIIVVNNGSTDETHTLLEHVAQRAAAAHVPMHVITHKHNLGCATARNLAVAQASGDEIVFMDNDIIVPDPCWLQKFTHVLHTRQNAAIVGPKLCYPFEPRNIQCAGVAVSPTGRVLFRGRGRPRNDPRFSRCQEVQSLISACWIFRRKLYDEIGGLDEIFNPIQFEDLDFCYRARSRGHRLFYTPDPVIHHWESITSTDTPSLNNRYVVIKNGMRFKKRWRHMFEKENGPRDDETRWHPVEMPTLERPRTR